MASTTKVEVSKCWQYADLSPMKSDSENVYEMFNSKQYAFSTCNLIVQRDGVQTEAAINYTAKSKWQSTSESSKNAPITSMRRASSCQQCILLVSTRAVAVLCCTGFVLDYIANHCNAHPLVKSDCSSCCWVDTEQSLPAGKIARQSAAVSAHQAVHSVALQP